MIRPVRLQLSRRKGFDLQAHSRAVNGLEAVNVARPGKWGNPFTKIAVINWHLGEYMDDRLAIWREEAVALFRAWATHDHEPAYFVCSTIPEAWSIPDCTLDFSPLRGFNLACWCAGQPCHADILLELANR